VPRWALDDTRVLERDDVLGFVATTWEVVLVGPAPRGAAGSGDLLAGSVPPDAVCWLDVPVVRGGAVVLSVPAGIIGEPQDRERATLEGPPFTLDGDVFQAGGHADLIRLFLPFGLDTQARASGVLEVGYHRAYEERPDWGQVGALRAAASQVAIAVETARLYEDTRRHAEQLELSADVSRAIASSIDLDQTLALVARNLVRLVDASTCQIALYEEDCEGWYGAAASDQEDLWRRQRGERPQASFLFDVLDRAQAVVIEDTSTGEHADPAYVAAFGVRSLLALPLEADGEIIGAA